MKKSLFFCAVAALFLAASCHQDELCDPVFTGTIAGQDGKTTFELETGISAWVLGDTITVTDAAGRSSKYTVSNIDAEGKADFDKLGGQPILGAGPYKAVYGTAPSKFQIHGQAIPSLPMSAESSTTDLLFAVSCGILELTVIASDTNKVKNVCMIEAMLNDTTVYQLKCNPPVDIIDSAVFNIVLPAGTYKNIFLTNGDYLCDTVKSTAINVPANTIKRGIIQYVKFRYAKDLYCRLYKVITINGVNWMAENFACDKYDTESEVYTDDPGNYFRDHKYIIPKAQPSTPTYKDTLRTPYYTNASDTSTWSNRTAAKKQQTALSNEQIAKMGLLYNWAAAVGVATDLLRTTDFTGMRQGICPNGWHVPSGSELDELKSYVEGQKGTNTGGSHLKSTSGWYDAGNPGKYPQGVDTYNFNLLPAGFAAGDSISNVGAAGHILTSSPSSSRESKFYYAYGSYTNSKLPASDGAPKCNGRSLRCVKNVTTTIY